MKRLLVLLALILVVPSAFALQVTSPTLGGDDARPNEDVSATFTVTNNGNEVLTDFLITSNAASKYDIEFGETPVSLGPGASQTVTVNGHVPSDFSGRVKIGKITVTATKAGNSESAADNTNDSNDANGTNTDNPFGGHDFQPDEQNPDGPLPVAMSATNDCGQNSPAVGMDVVGQWHAGTCDWTPDIEVKLPQQMDIDAGWARIHAEEKTDYWIKPVQYVCGEGSAQEPPQNWINGGKIHTGPGLCDGSPELAGGEAGWVGMYTKPSASGKLIFVIAHDKCGGSPQSVPENGVVLGRVRTGPNTCDGNPEAVSYTGDSIDAGAMYVVYVPLNHDEPENGETRGELEQLDWTGLSGWAYDPDAPVISVNVFVDGQFWKELIADQERNDLVTDGTLPDAFHGFDYEFTSADLAGLDQAEDHTFSVYAVDVPGDESVPLQGSPATLQGSGNGDGNDGSDDGNDGGDDSGGIDDGDNGGDDGNDGGNGSNDVSASADLFMETGEVLVIDRVKIECDSLESVDEGEDIEALPGQECFVTVRVENVHDEIDLEDVEIEIESDSADVDGDEAEISSIDADDREEEQLTLSIDEDAYDGKVDITIIAKGEDDDGNEYRDEFEFSLEIERAKNELTIARMTTNPSRANRCFDTRVDVRVYVENTGTRDQEHMAVELSVPALNFKKKLRDLELDEGDEDRVTFSVPIDEKTAFGSFIATAKVFYENVVQIDSKSTNIEVMKCDDEDASDSSEAGSTAVTEPVVVSPPKVPESQLIVRDNEKKSSSSSSAFYTGLLVVLNLIALTVLGVMTAGFIKKYKQQKQKVDESDAGDEPRYEDFY